MSDNVSITIDGQPMSVPMGTLVIRAAEEIGVYVPRFCDHPYLAPLGACRQCLVEVEGQRKPLTACTTTVTEGMVIKTQFTSEVAAQAQEGVLELLLINHPLDCPMCDKGGECPLQDQALAFGPGGSRLADPKRRYQKPVPVSPIVYLDRERCVLCARCTRFASEISGDPFIELFERGALEQVAIFEDEPYESNFSGNVIQICPVGALTSADFRFKARPFDMESTSSICNHCSSGCNLTVQTRRGEIVRVLAADNAEVNEVWSCDKGRFGHAYVQRPERITEPLVKKHGEFVPVSWAEAIRTVAERIDAVKRDGAGAALLAGARLPDEDAFMVSRFARTVLGTNDIDHRLRAGTDEEDDILCSLANATPVTYADIDAAKAVVIVGVDATEESPILFLRLRKAVARGGVPMFEVHPRRTTLTRAGARSLVCAPGTEAGVLWSVAKALGETGTFGADDPFVRVASSLNATAVAEQSGVDRADMNALAEALATAGSQTVIIIGSRLADSPGAMNAAWNLAALSGAKIARVDRRAGASGSIWAGVHPRLLPAGRRVDNDRERAEVEAVWRTSLPSLPGRDGRSLLDAAARGALGMLYLIGSDPVQDMADATLGARALDSGVFTVAHDLLMNDTTWRADVVLPASAIPERSGTFTDWEGRAQVFSSAIDPGGLVQDDWQILTAISTEMRVASPPTISDVRLEMRALAKPSTTAAPVEPVEPNLRRSDDAFPFSLVSYPLLIDAGSMLLGAEDLLKTARDPFIEISTEDAERIGIRAGDRVRATSASGHVEAPARISKGLQSGTVFIPANQQGLRAAGLLDAAQRLTLVHIQRTSSEVGAR